MDRFNVYAMFNGYCAYCGCDITLQNFQVDHIHPQYLGGKDIKENYYPACRSCNATKATYTLEKFRQRLLDDVKRLERDSSKFRILKRFGIFKQVKTELVFYFEALTEPSQKEV